MLDIDKQYVFDEQGKAIAVQIPLDQFQQIEQLLSAVSETRESITKASQAESENRSTGKQNWNMSTGAW